MTFSVKIAETSMYRNIYVQGRFRDELLLIVLLSVLKVVHRYDGDKTCRSRSLRRSQVVMVHVVPHNHGSNGGYILMGFKKSSAP